MNYSSNFINQRSVRPFRNAVLLGRIGGNAIMFYTMQASELMKFTIDVLTSVVSPDFLNYYFSLVLPLTHKFFEISETFVLPSHQI